jgi:hypothetical protein
MEWLEWSPEYLPYYVRFARDSIEVEDVDMHTFKFKVPSAIFGRILLGDAR